MEYDVIIVGAGFAGSVCARSLAEQGKKVLILEKKNHIGGTAYDCINSDNILIHQYGPHIFHTNNKEVFDWLSRFTDWQYYEHKVVANIPHNKNRLIFPLPFNFTSLDITNKNSDYLKSLLLKEFNTKKISVFDLCISSNIHLKQLGNYIFKTVFKNYSQKQWGTKNIDKSVLNRVPINLSYNSNYFEDIYQCIPKNGYNELFKNILNHENIDLKLNTDALQCIKLVNNDIWFNNKIFKGKVIYTGEIDKLFKYCYGKLPYRSVLFNFITLNKDNYQNYPTVNYPLDKKYTRITEFKNITNQQIKNKTTILKEYPVNHTDNLEPFYPILNSKNTNQYNKYKVLSKNFNNLFFLGRLAEYKYYNMDEIVLNALNLSKEIGVLK